MHRGLGWLAGPRWGGPWRHRWRGRGWRRCLRWRLSLKWLHREDLAADELRLLEDYKRALEHEIEALRQELRLVEERIRELKKEGEQGQHS